MPKCIFHVGMHKTGTTSVQHSLKDLADSNFYYARLRDKPNHSVSIYNAFAEKPEEHPLNRNFVGNREAMRRNSVTARHDLTASIEAANGRTFVLSGEGFIRLSGPELRKFMSFLTRHGYDQFEVIAYVRSPGAYLSSAIQQHIRSGMKRFNIEAGAPKYRRRFAKFDRLFGRENVNLFKFDPAAFVGNDVVLDFCARTGIPETSINLTRKNESISRMVAQLIYQYGQSASGGNLPPMKSAFGDRISAALSDPDKIKFRLSPRLVQPVIEANRKDIEWMESRLGQPFNEDLGEETDLDIRSEDDLLTPILGIEGELRAAASKLGLDPTTLEAGTTWDLLLAIAQFGLKDSARSRPGANAANEASRSRDPMPKKIRSLKTYRAAQTEVSPKRLVPLMPLTRGPTPLINKDKKLIVLWSPKSACTTTYVWFSHVSGFSDEVKAYDAWPHHHRREVYERSKFYVESVEADHADFRVLKVLREPYSRAVSIYRHALQTPFADKDIEVCSHGKISRFTGYSFQYFLDMLASFNMRRVDVHYRPQLHPYEELRAPDRVINISKQDLYSELSDFETSVGRPPTDFKNLTWLHRLEGQRKAKQEQMPGDALDTVAFTTHQVVKLGQFPSYDQLLTPEAKQKIETIYKVDFDAYREYL